MALHGLELTLCLSLERGACVFLPSPRGPFWLPYPQGEDTPQGSSSGALGGSELACALYPSEPHVPLRGAVAGSCGCWEDPGAPTGRGPDTAAVTGDGQGLAGDSLCLGPQGRNQRAQSK